MLRNFILNWKKKFDLILDKACLDTFLFRSRQRGGGQPYAQLVKNVLNNIHSWLSNTGVYLILTPRRKLKSVRDFVGFESVERHILDLNDLRRGDLEGDDEGGRIFLYVCHKNPDYSPSNHDAFALDQQKPTENDTCPSCKITFYGFRKGEKLEHRGERFWFREWKGHCVHCQGL